MRISAELGFKSAVSFGEGDMEERFSRELPLSLKKQPIGHIVVHFKELSDVIVGTGESETDRGCVGATGWAFQETSGCSYTLQLIG